MSICSDATIRRMSVNHEIHSPGGPMVFPFREQKDRPGVVSYGVSSYGYDVRVGRNFKISTTPVDCDDEEIIDPKNISPTVFVDHVGDFCLIPAGCFALAETVEEIYVPRRMLGVCVGKSTYARCGIIVNVTPLEPEWRGKVTVEISNTARRPAKIYANEGIMQVLFFWGDLDCDVSYADKKGKYQDQKGLTLPFVK